MLCGINNTTAPVSPAAAAPADGVVTLRVCACVADVTRRLSLSGQIH